MSTDLASVIGASGEFAQACTYWRGGRGKGVPAPAHVVVEAVRGVDHVNGGVVTTTVMHALRDEIPDVSVYDEIEIGEDMWQVIGFDLMPSGAWALTVERSQRSTTGRK